MASPNPETDERSMKSKDKKNWQNQKSGGFLYPQDEVCG